MSVAVSRKNTVIAVTVICATIVSLLAVGCGGGRVVAVVNGEPVSWEEYENEYSRRMTLLEEESPGELEGKEGEELKEETRRQVLTDLIREKILEQKSEELGVKVDREELEETVRSEKRDLGEKEFISAIEESGLTEKEYTDEIAEDLLVEALGNEVTEGVSVTREEVERYFLENRDLFSHGEMVNLAHILVDNEGQAKVIAEEAARGEDWGELARRFSEDISTRDNRGEMGWVERGTIEPVLEEAAFGLQVGQVGGPVSASDGYHVIKVLEKKEAHVPSFEEMEGEAKKALLKEKKDEEFQGFLKSAYANAEVELEPAGMRWDVNLGMVVEDSTD